MKPALPPFQVSRRCLKDRFPGCIGCPLAIALKTPFSVPIWALSIHPGIDFKQSDTPAETPDCAKHWAHPMSSRAQYDRDIFPLFAIRGHPHKPGQIVVDRVL